MRTTKRRRNNAPNKVIIETSGFAYSDWKTKFYPQGLRQNEWLEFYARHFNGVEINSSFYHLPRENVVQAWHDRTPENFTFVLKGSKFATHRRALRDCAEAVALFYKRAAGLREKLGAVLWQLPPDLEHDLALLGAFLDLLPSSPLAVLEFRHPSWYVPDTFALLHARGAAFCLHDLPVRRDQTRADSAQLAGEKTAASREPFDSGRIPMLPFCYQAHNAARSLPAEFPFASRVAYLRFHGYGRRYGGTYPDALLKQCAQWLQFCGAEQIYAFFNNDISGHALDDARRFREYLLSR